MQSLDADTRIKLAIGSQFCDLQMMQDKIAQLQGQLAERDAEITRLKASAADAGVGPASSNNGVSR